MWYLYITKNRDGCFYTGITTNVERRLQEHSPGKGGRHTRRNRANRLVYTDQFPTRAAAEVRERQIKRWSRKKKKALIEGNAPELRRLSISRDH